MNRRLDVQRLGTRLAAVLLGAALLIFGVSPPVQEAGEEAPRGTLTIGVEAELRGLDTLKVRGAANCDAIAYATMHEPLFKLDEAGRVIPVLALSATPSADGTSWTVKLRDGVARLFAPFL